MPRIHFAALSLMALSLVSCRAAGTVRARSARLLVRATAWRRGSMVALGKMRSGATLIESAGNILAVHVDRAEALASHVRLVATVRITDHARTLEDAGVRVAILLIEPAAARVTRLEGSRARRASCAPSPIRATLRRL